MWCLTVVLRQSEQDRNDSFIIPFQNTLQKEPELRASSGSTVQDKHLPGMLGPETQRYFYLYSMSSRQLNPFWTLLWNPWSIILLFVFAGRQRRFFSPEPLIHNGGWASVTPCKSFIDLTHKDAWSYVYFCFSLQSTLHGFHIRGFNQPPIKNIFLKIPEGFNKQNLQHAEHCTESLLIMQHVSSFCFRYLRRAVHFVTRLCVLEPAYSVVTPRWYHVTTISFSLYWVI